MEAPADILAAFSLSMAGRIITRQKCPDCGAGTRGRPWTLGKYQNRDALMCRCDPPRPATAYYIRIKLFHVKRLISHILPTACGAIYSRRFCRSFSSSSRLYFLKASSTVR